IVVSTLSFQFLDIHDAVGDAAFDRGQGYVYKGHVIAIEADEINAEETSFHATVRGSGKQIYAQEIDVSGSGNRVGIEGHCSCPVAYNCKHVAAVLTQYLQTIAAQLKAPLKVQPAAPAAFWPTATTISAAPLPRVIDNWLQRIDDERTKAVVGLPAAGNVYRDGHYQAPSNVASRLIFALVAGHNGKQITLHLCKARLRKDGLYSSVKPLSDGYSFQDTLRELMQASDQDAVDMFTALTANVKAAAFYQRQSNHCELRGKMGAQLLHLLLVEKNVLWANSLNDLAKGQTHHMQLAPSRNAHLHWREQQLEDTSDEPLGRMSSWGRPNSKLAVSAYKPARDALKLVWQFSVNDEEQSASGTAIAGEVIDYVLPTDPPWYINNLSSGELHLPAALMQMAPDDLTALVTQAPLLDASNKLQVAQQLLAQGISHLIPLPIEVPFAQLDGVRPQALLVLDSVTNPDGTILDFAQLHFVYDGTLAPAVFAPTLQRKSAQGI
ncbi:MAG: SWIM zinc finger family protein, partial [Glaciimonas sp.]|nr:SWIM zinc finger family protein [Glaciimonas sp.]